MGADQEFKNDIIERLEKYGDVVGSKYDFKDDKSPYDYDVVLSALVIPPKNRYAACVQELFTEFSNDKKFKPEGPYKAWVEPIHEKPNDKRSRIVVLVRVYEIPPARRYVDPRGYKKHQLPFGLR